MKKACVIGHPVQHSLSPKLHSYWLKHYGISGSYTTRNIHPLELKEQLEHLLEEGYQGFNVTIPHKETILPLLDVVDDHARHIGAVNTVVVRNGKTYGSNSDAFGFIENIKTFSPNYFKVPIILGAGGAAKAIVKGLADVGAEEIIVLARNPEKAAPLAQISNKVKIYAWQAGLAIVPRGTMLINTTPVGMMHAENPTEKHDAPSDAMMLVLEQLPHDALVTDIVYSPLITPLLSAAEKRGNPTIDGLGMLIFQAIPGFEMWFGIRPEVQAAELKTLKNMLLNP